MQYKITRNTALSMLLACWSAVAWAQAAKVAASFEYGLDFYSLDTWILIVFASVVGAVGAISSAQRKDSEMVMTPWAFGKFLINSIIGGFLAFVAAEYYCQSHTPPIQPSGGLVAALVLISAYNSQRTISMASALARNFAGGIANAFGGSAADKESK